MKSIFVQIASYHDYELEKTIYDAIEKSSKKYKIFFGVHSVYHQKNNVKIPELENVRYIMSKAPNNLGAGMGRYLAHSLYDNEDYYLQIDSHSRFLPNWDKLLVEDALYYQALGYKKPAISCYPSAYFFDKNGKVVIPSASPQNIEFRDDDNFAEYLAPGNEGSVDEPSTRQKSVSAAFLFTVAPFMDVNKHFNFAPEEEFGIGLRLFTRGYDLLIPRNSVVYHYYYPYASNELNDSRRKNVWDDKSFHNRLFVLQEIGKQKYREMIEQNKIGRYWLGEERSKEQYAELVGLDFEKKTIISRKKMNNDPI